jgi:hypothetical protein
MGFCHAANVTEEVPRVNEPPKHRCNVCVTPQGLSRECLAQHPGEAAAARREYSTHDTRV